MQFEYTSNEEVVIKTGIRRQVNQNGEFVDWTHRARNCALRNSYAMMAVFFTQLKPGCIHEPRGCKVRTLKKGNSMNTANKLSVTGSLLMLLSVPSMAQLVVSSPASGSEVQSPFTLSATAGTCSSEAVTAIGYSLDSSPDATALSGNSIQTSVSLSNGSHQVNVMSWGDAGAVCVANVSVSVGQASPGGGPVPPNATSVSALQTMSNWKAVHDTGGKGKAKGSTTIVSSPSLSGSARQFDTSYKADGDERYSVSFGDDTDSQNFFYDGWVYFKDSASDIRNLELDMNQTMANGETVIFGVQCDGWSGTWDYTTNAGTPKHQKDRWLHTKTPCDPRKWSVNTWHHVQISYSRDDKGVVTYNSAWLDGVEQPLNATAPSATDLGWGHSLITNFQVDGSNGSGKSTAYLDNLVISRW
jgi:hypothetical protein